MKSTASRGCVLSCRVILGGEQSPAEWPPERGANLSRIPFRLRAPCNASSSRYRTSAPSQDTLLSAASFYVTVNQLLEKRFVNFVHVRTSFSPSCSSRDVNTTWNLNLDDS